MATATLGSHAANTDEVFAVENMEAALGVSSSCGGGESFLRNGPRSRSATTWRTTSRSIGLCRSADPSDNALKQRLLMLRGMPSLHRVMSASASLVNRGISEAYPAIRSR